MRNAAVSAERQPIRGSHTTERRVMIGVMCFFFLTQVGCWEQVSKEWFEQMKVHYMSDHADVMAANANKSKEDGMKWMAEMKAKFESL